MRFQLGTRSTLDGIDATRDAWGEYAQYNQGVGRAAALKGRSITHAEARAKTFDELELEASARVPSQLVAIAGLPPSEIAHRLARDLRAAVLVAYKPCSAGFSPASTRKAHESEGELA